MRRGDDGGDIADLARYSATLRYPSSRSTEHMPSGRSTCAEWPGLAAIGCHAGQLRPGTQKPSFCRRRSKKREAARRAKKIHVLIIIIKSKHVARAARDENVAGGAATECRIGIISRSSMQAFFAHRDHDADGERSAAWRIEHQCSQPGASWRPPALEYVALATRPPVLVGIVTASSVAGVVAERLHTTLVTRRSNTESQSGRDRQ